MTLSTEQQIEVDKDAFMQRTRGVSAWTVGRAMRILTPGIDWRGTPRGRIADEWARARVLSNPVYPQMARVTLDQLCKKIEEIR